MKTGKRPDTTDEVRRVERSSLKRFREAKRLGPARFAKDALAKLKNKHDDLQALHDLALARWLRDDLEGAVRLYRQLLAKAPESCVFRLLLCGTLLDSHVPPDHGKLDEAYTLAREACELQRDNLDYWDFLQTITSAMGNWAESWRLARYVAARRGTPIRTFADILVRGKRILVTPEALAGGKERISVWMQKRDGNFQEVINEEIRGSGDGSLGDTLMYVRYITRLEEQRALPIVLAPKPLVSLFRRSFPGATVLEPGEVSPCFELHGRLKDMPMYKVGQERHVVPSWHNIPMAEPKRLLQWRREIGATKASLRVGLCYQGDKRLERDRYRSVPLRFFEPLADVPGVTLFSLQIPPDNKQTKYAGFPVIDLGGLFDLSAGFEDIAAAMMELDLIIAVDSAPAHLAGALDKSTFLLLSQTDRDHRWDLAETKTPWYPSVYLFRQKQAGDWEEPVRRIADLLKWFMRERRQPMQPRSPPAMLVSSFDVGWTG